MIFVDFLIGTGENNRPIIACLLGQLNAVNTLVASPNSMQLLELGEGFLREKGIS